MKSKEFTTVTLIGVALADENTFWLCEPINSKQAASGEWKSLKCRWLYPVDSSISRFAGVAGFEHTDSVYELDQSAISRVERFAAIDLNVQAKRQRVDRGVFFFVPVEEMHRLDERYKQLLRKEVQMKQQQQQQLQEQQQKYNDSVKVDDDEECITGARASMIQSNEDATKSASRHAAGSSSPFATSGKYEAVSFSPHHEDGHAHTHANREGEHSRQTSRHDYLHPLRVPSDGAQRDGEEDADEDGYAVQRQTHQPTETSAAELAVAPASSAASLGSRYAAPTSSPTTTLLHASGSAFDSPHHRPAGADDDNNAARGERSVRRQAFAAFLDDVSAQSEAPHRRRSNSMPTRASQVNRPHSSYHDSHTQSNTHTHTHRREHHDAHESSRGEASDHFPHSSTAVTESTLGAPSSSSGTEPSGRRPRGRPRTRPLDGEPSVVRSHKRKTPHVGTTIYHSPSADEPMGDHCSSEAFDWPLLCIVHRGSVDYLCPALNGNDYGFRLHRIMNNAFPLFVLFSSEMNNSYTLDPPASGVPVYQSAVLTGEAGEGCAYSRVLVMTRGRSQRMSRFMNGGMLLAGMSSYPLAQDDTDSAMNNYHVHDENEDGQNEMGGQVRSRRNEADEEAEGGGGVRGEKDESGRQGVRTWESIAVPGRFAPRRRYRRHRHRFRDSDDSSSIGSSSSSSRDSSDDDNNDGDRRRRGRPRRHTRDSAQNSRSRSSSSDAHPHSRQRHHGHGHGHHRHRHHASHGSGEPIWQRKDAEQAAHILSEGLLYQPRGPGRPTRALQLARAALAAAAAQGVVLRDARDAMNAVRMVTMRQYAPRARIDLSEAALTGRTDDSAARVRDDNTSRHGGRAALHDTHTANEESDKDDVTTSEDGGYVAPQKHQLQVAGVNMWTDPGNAVPSAKALARRFGFTRASDGAALHTTVFEDGSCVTYSPASACRVAPPPPPHQQMPTAPAPVRGGGGRDHDDLDMRGLLEHIQLAKEQVNQ